MINLLSILLFTPLSPNRRSFVFIFQHVSID